MTNQTRLVVLLHADVVGSTALVQKDEQLSHTRIQGAFRRFSDMIVAAGGQTLEIRGDALVAEFARASDATSTALEFQKDNTAALRNIGDGIRPELRIGIALGEVIIADGTVTGAGVILAQRLEQLANPGGICISAAVREALPGRLALHAEDLGEQQLKGFDHRQRVYRLQVAAEREDTPETTSPDTTSNFLLPDSRSTRPSIAVLPFDNLSGDPEQVYFADGLTEELITALSRSDDLFVIARNSSFTFRGGDVDVQRVGAELGARYLLEGSVRKAGNRVRITAQLIETASRQHVWAERFDGTLEDILDLQDQVTIQIVGQLLPNLERAETIRVSRIPAPHPSAYDQYLRALHHFHAFSRDDILQALKCLDSALKQSPSFARALALAGVCRARMVINAWDVANDEQHIEIGLKQAIQAPLLEPDDSTVLWMSGFALGRLSGDHARGIDLLERAKDLNPNSYTAFGFAGLMKTLIGDAEGAIHDLEHATRLNPVDPRSFTFYTSLARAYNAAGRFEDAKRQSAQAIRQNPRYEQAHREFIVSCQLSGQTEEARVAAGRFMDAFPDFSLQRLRARDTRLRVPPSTGLEDHYAALKAAGVPEAPRQ